MVNTQGKNMSEKTVTVYVTKYALTTGIMREHGCQLVMSTDQSREYASKNGGMLFVEIGKDAFFLEAEAVEHAKAMAEAKLKSLRAQQAKVSKLLVDGFKVKDGTIISVTVENI